MKAASGDLFINHWKVIPFILLHALAVLVFASWILPEGLQLWRAVDIPVFHWLNGSLGHAGGSWAQLWALANSRMADLAPLGILLFSFLVPGIWFHASQLRSALLGFIVLLVVLLLVRQTLDIVVEVLQVSTLSPSLIVDGAILLGEFFPQWDPKDQSTESFPGDHATVVLFWLAYVMVYGRMAGVLLSALLAVIFMMPRLIGGAHWLSDNIVGGVFCVCITMAWGSCSPLLYRVTCKINPYLDYLIDHTGVLFPFLKRFAFFNNNSGHKTDEESRLTRETFGLK